MHSYGAQQTTELCRNKTKIVWGKVLRDRAKDKKPGCTLWLALFIRTEIFPGCMAAFWHRCLGRAFWKWVWNCIWGMRKDLVQAPRPAIREGMGRNQLMGSSPGCRSGGTLGCSLQQKAGWHLSYRWEGHSWVFQSLTCWLCWSDHSAIPSPFHPLLFQPPLPSFTFPLSDEVEPKMGEEVINANCLYKVAEGRSFLFAFPNPSEPIPGLWLHPRQICPHKTVLTSFQYCWKHQHVKTPCYY